MTDLQVGNVGTIIRLTIVDQSSVAVDVSNATLVMYLRSPSHKMLAKTPTFTTDGTDGVIQYQTVAGDLDAAGTWTVQAKGTIGSSVFFSNVLAVPVLDNIN